MKQTKDEKINRLLTRNVDTVTVKDHLEKALKSGKKLRVKHGIDPTGEQIHIGRAVVLWKLKEFQDLGHKIVLIIGDFTAQIGDPSDKLEKRPFLAEKEVEKNLRNYLPQIGKILNLKKTEVRHNSEWLSKLDLRETSELAETFTFAQIIERKNFKERWEKHQEISLRETLYPLMQGYDSVAVKANVELGGADQLFNLMAGRKIQERYNQKPQDIMTTEMLIGLDGRKMSTSWGNVINITDSPKEQYGKIMSMRDNIMTNYFRLAANLPETEIAKHEIAFKAGQNPKEIKEILAAAIVARYHGEKAAERATEEFTKVFRKKELPDEIPDLKPSACNLKLTDLLIEAGVSSKSEARRLITQGGVSIYPSSGIEKNKKIPKNPNEIQNLKPGDILKIGKRKFFKIKTGY